MHCNVLETLYFWKRSSTCALGDCYQTFISTAESIALLRKSEHDEHTGKSLTDILKYFVFS